MAARRFPIWCGMRCNGRLLFEIDAPPRTCEGPVLVKLFAEVRKSADELFAVCRRMRRDGVNQFQIEVMTHESR